MLVYFLNVTHGCLVLSLVVDYRYEVLCHWKLNYFYNFSLIQEQYTRHNRLISDDILANSDNKKNRPKIIRKNDIYLILWIF